VRKKNVFTINYQDKIKAIDSGVFARNTIHNDTISLDYEQSSKARARVLLRQKGN